MAFVIRNPVEAVTRPLKDLPKCSDLKQGSLDDVSEYLFDHGVASGSIAKLLEDIGELVRIANGTRGPACRRKMKLSLI
jgi:hypothetical protein